jgi:2-polyprenyl-3-methyl-5-hydroxy-6-metoxy-1,4-benzoquinol methylase
MTQLDPKKVEEISDRALAYLSGAGISGLIYLGDQLGLYRALEAGGSASSVELAKRAALNERWVREWLHGQASAGLVRYLGDGRYELTPEQAAVLAREDGPEFLAGGFALMMPLLSRWKPLFESFRTGRGARYNDLGHDHAVGESRFSAPWMHANLVSTILSGIEGLTSKLSAGAAVADIGCGTGKAAIAMAKAYPRSHFHGYDSAEVAVQLATKNLAAAGLDNVNFHHVAGRDLPANPKLDFVLTWDTLHDQTDPDATMRAIRRAIAPDGVWLIVDINGQPTPEENYDHPLGGLLYAFSVLDCLGCGTSQEGGASLGTLGLPEPIARQMTKEAGFTRFAVHDFGNPLNSFFEVRP